MPNPSEMMRDLTEDAHRRHAIAKGYYSNLRASKGTRELALRQMRALERDYPELAEPTPAEAAAVTLAYDTLKAAREKLKTISLAETGAIIFALSKYEGGELLHRYLTQD